LRKQNTTSMNKLNKIRKTLNKIGGGILLLAFMFNFHVISAQIGRFNYGLYDVSNNITSNPFLSTWPYFPNTSPLSNYTRLEVGKGFLPTDYRTILYGGNLYVNQDTGLFNSNSTQWSKVGLWYRDLGVLTNPSYTTTPDYRYLADLHNLNNYGASFGLRAASSTTTTTNYGEQNQTTTYTPSANKEAVISFIHKEGETPSRLVFENIINVANPIGGYPPTVNNLMTLKANGNLGIGVSDPQAFFEMKGPSGVRPYFSFNDNSGVALFSMGYTGNISINGLGSGEKLFINGNQRIRSTGALSIFQIENQSGSDLLKITDPNTEISNTIIYKNKNITSNDQYLFIKPSGELYAGLPTTSTSAWDVNGNQAGGSASLVFGTRNGSTPANILFHFDGIGYGSLNPSNATYANGHLDLITSTSFGKSVPFDPTISHRFFTNNTGSNHISFEIYRQSGLAAFTVRPNDIGIDKTLVVNGSTFLNGLAFLGGNTEVTGNVTPAVSGNYNLGSSSKKWNEVWALNGSIQTSDVKCKENIENLNYGIETINKMRPVTYEWKENANGIRIGFIAQELEKLVPEVVVVDSVNNYGVRYTELIPVLTKGIQEQQVMIDSLNQKLNLLIQSNAEKIALKEQSTFQKEKINKQPILFQNTPNPFRGMTRIDYYVPITSNSAFIKVTDMNGKLVKAFALNELGFGQVELDCSELAAGQYQYSLLINQQIFDTKKMQIGVTFEK